MGVEGPEAARAGKELSRTMAAASPFMVLLPFAAAVAVILRSGATSPRVSASAGFALLASLGLVALVALTRRRRPRAGVLAACHTLAWAPVLAACAWQSIGEAIVSLPMRGCDTGMAFLIFAVPAGGVVLVILGLAAGLLFIRRTTDRAIRTTACAATGLALVAFAFAAVRMARPDPDTYLASLELVTELQGDSHAQILGREYRYERGAPSPPIPVRTFEGGTVLPPRVSCTLVGLGEPKEIYALAGVCPTLRFRLDHGRDIVVVDSPRDADVARFAFRPSKGEAMSISPSTVADHLAPPIGWTVGAGLGGLLGAAFVLAASRVRRHASALVAFQAKHAGGGVVELESGEAVHVDAALGLPPGNIVLADIGEQLPTYRQIGTPTFGAASAGTLDELRGKLLDVAASLDAVAIAAAMLGSTPLLVARLVAGL